MILKNLVIKMGRVKVVLLITLSSILLSCFINWLGSFFYNYNHDFLFISYLISIIVPLIVAPLCSWALIGLLLKINQMENQMRYIATTDQLTGIKSRASFFSLSDSALNYVIQNKKKCTLIMLDLDFFKSINDTYGHAGGDIVLRNFGNLLKSICRKEDIIGRIGGEEFCILLIGCDSKNAVKIAKEIILKIHKQILKVFFFMGLSHILCKPLNWCKLKLH